MRISWVHPELARRASDALRRGRTSWEEVFDDDGHVDPGEPPEGVPAEVWPRIAEHVARAERVREMVALAGAQAARRRFARSPHAVERAALVEAGAAGEGEAEAELVAGVLACAIDELVAYGHFLSRLIELGAHSDPDGTVSLVERFVSQAGAVRATEPSWPERVRAARDGLASLYVRVGRDDDAEALFAARFGEEPDDTAVAIGAARAFLEAGHVSRSIRWLERAAARARDVGRETLADRLRQKAAALRARLS